MAAKGTYWFLPEHVGYELLRRGQRLARGRRRWGWAALGALIAAAVLPGALSVASLVAGGVLAGLWRRRSGIARKPFALAERFLQVNRNEKQLDPGERSLPDEPGDAARELATGADRVLVCEHERYARFLLANDFHLHHACPVLGPEGSDGTFPGLLTRLRGDGLDRALVLHDMTPQGSAFARRLRADLGWFVPASTRWSSTSGSRPPSIGRPGRPLREIRGAGGAGQDTGVEVSAVRPGRLLGALGRSVAAGTPLALTALAPPSRDSEASIDSE